MSVALVLLSDQAKLSAHANVFTILYMGHLYSETQQIFVDKNIFHHQ